MYQCGSSLSINLAFSFFFFNDTATTEIYTLSLHDALPIFVVDAADVLLPDAQAMAAEPAVPGARGIAVEVKDRGFIFLRENLRSEEHTSELQSRQYLVCRLLLEKKKKNQ